jgi:hypothetical protein
MRIASQQPISYDVNRAVRSAKRWRKVARKSRVAWCTRRPSASNFSCTRPTTTSGCRSAYVFVNTNAWRNCDWPRAVAGHPGRGPHHSGHCPVQTAVARSLDSQSIVFFSTPGRRGCIRERQLVIHPRSDWRHEAAPRSRGRQQLRHRRCTRGSGLATDQVNHVTRPAQRR